MIIFGVEQSSDVLAFIAMLVCGLPLLIVQIIRRDQTSFVFPQKEQDWFRSERKSLERGWGGTKTL